MPETSRRIHSSRSSSIAEAGRSTTHSQRPSASPATTERSSSRSAVARRDRPQRHRLAADPYPHHRRVPHRPRVRDRDAGVPAQRAPSPVPDSSLTTNTSTGPSRALVPELQVIVARASRARTADHREVAHRPAGAHRPGQVRRELPGRGQRLREPVVRRGFRAAAAPASVRARGSPRRPLPRPRQVSPRAGWGSADTRSGAACPHGPEVGAHASRRSGSTARDQEFQRRTTGVSRSWPSTDTVAVSRKRWRPSGTGSPSQRAASTRSA